MRAREAPSSRDRAAIGARNESSIRGAGLLVAVLGAPAAWTTHLLGAYLIVALWCTTGWRGMGIAVAVLTIACAGAAAAVGLLGYRLWQRGQAGMLEDDERGEAGSWDARMGERGARAVFLAVMAVLLAALFAYLIVLQGVPAIFTPACDAREVP